MDAQNILGSYRLIAELGHGGMADVFLAAVEGPMGSGFTKLAVVKRLRSHLVEDPEFVSMLIDEARLTSRLAHPNVVQLFEVGHVDGEYFLAMEHLEGQPLHRIQQRAKRRGITVPREVYYGIICDVLAGLHYAHELADFDGTPFDVVHRDVTPHNVFVTYAGAVKVVDFGIAKAVGRVTETKHGIVKGKIRYMSPEQAAGAELDRRTDIFAAGVILWNAATGMKLWGDLDELDVARGLHRGNYPASPCAICPEVPPEIDMICRKALAHRREDRYRTAAEMRTDLEAFLEPTRADAHAKLTAAMKDLFEGDRAKLRAVLETSGLMSVASIDVFTAATGGRPVTPVVPAERSRKSSKRSSKRSSSSRKKRASPAEPSIAPLGVPARSKPAASKSKASTARVTGVVETLAVAAALCVAAVAVVFSVRSGAVRAQPQPATISPELTVLSRGVRIKKESIPEQVVDGKTPVVRSTPHAGRGTAGGGSPSISASTPSRVGVTPQGDVIIDKADPWDAGSTTGKAR